MHRVLQMGECVINTYGNSNVFNYQKITVVFVTFLATATELKTK